MTLMLGAWQALRNCKDGRKNPCGEIFAALPNADEYPDYFEVIAKPISLSEIKGRVEARSYRGWAAFEADVQLMLRNARTYNEEGSEICRNADVLEAVFRRHARKAEQAAYAALWKRS